MGTGNIYGLELRHKLHKTTTPMENLTDGRN